MAALFEDLNSAQREAVTHTGGPLLVIAGAGTGKTTVITRRLAWLITEKFIPSNEVLALTFTEKAAGEMVERVDRLLPYGYLDLWIHTFHGFCERILRAHAIDIGLPGDFRVVAPLDAWRLVRQHLSRFELDYYRPLGNPTKFLHALIRHFSRCKDELITPDEYLRHAESSRLDADSFDEAKTQEVRRREEIAHAYHIYQQILLENSCLDFGDLIVQTLRLFRERPAILERYRRHFKSILVDEFQDTNWGQYELVKLLAGPKNELTVVGDDDQSIYKFRGASVANILQFEKDYSAAKRIVITENYRSRQEILDAAYQFIQLNNPNRLESPNLNKHLSSTRGVGAKVELIHARDEVGEVKQVITWISPKRAEGASWGDFAILLRANHQADPFIAAFDSAEIPYEFLASSGLLRKPIVLDILAWLRLLDNYHESKACWRILSATVLGLVPEDIIRLSNLARQKSWSLFEAMRQQALLELTPQSRLTLDRLSSLLATHAHRAKKESVGKLVYAFLHEFGGMDRSYLRWLTQPLQDGSGTLPAQRWSREQVSYLGQFMRRIEQFEATTPDPSVRAFLEEIEAARASGEEGALRRDLEELGPDAIHIMTVHGAKGLEFPYIIIPQLIDLRFPSVDRADQIELPEALVKERLPEGDWHLQEERRLFYVALTRARDGVLLTYADDYGGARKRRPSRFLAELGLLSDRRVGGIPASQSTPFAGRTVDAIDLHPAPPLPRPSSPGSAATAPQEAIPPSSARLDQTFSFTQLRAFETCPLQYKFAHILRLPILPRAPLQYGKVLHATLQKFLSLMMEQQARTQTDLFGLSSSGGVEIPPLETLMKIYEETWTDDWFEDRDQLNGYKKKGREALEWIWMQMKDKPPRPKYLERDFSLKIGEYRLRGRIDRIDETSEGSEIIDYKTGHAPKTLAADDKRQLLLYQMAAKDPHMLGMKPTNLRYIYLDDRTSLGFVGEEADEEKVRQWALGLMQKIEFNKFSPTPGPHCKFCDFRDICEFAQL